MFLTLVREGLQVEDLAQNGAKDAVASVVEASILITAVIAILIPATETFAEVVAVLLEIDVVAAIAIGRVLIGVRVLIVETPSVLTVGRARVIALLIAVVDRLPQHLRSILIGLVVAAAAIVTIVRAVIVVVVAPALQAQLVLAQTLEVALLITQLRYSPLLLEQATPLLFETLLLDALPAILLEPLLMALLCEAIPLILPLIAIPIALIAVIVALVAALLITQSLLLRSLLLLVSPPLLLLLLRLALIALGLAPLPFSLALLLISLTLLLLLRALRGATLLLLLALDADLV